MNIEIARFDELDAETLYQIVKLRIDCFVVEQDCPYHELDNKDKEAIHFYIKEGEKVISYLRLMVKDQNRAQIGRIATDSNHRGKGLAGSLIKSSFEVLDENIEIVYLHGQTHLQQYYESFGFVKKSEPYKEDGIPHIDMELDLKNHR